MIKRMLNAYIAYFLIISPIDSYNTTLSFFSSILVFLFPSLITFPVWVAVPAAFSSSSLLFSIISVSFFSESSFSFSRISISFSISSIVLEVPDFLIFALILASPLKSPKSELIFKEIFLSSNCYIIIIKISN